MQQPNVENIMKDEKNDITFKVLACRKLSSDEIVESIRYYMSKRKAKTIKRGSSITIMTITGFNE